jgi:hypothetical protein
MCYPGSTIDPRVRGYGRDWEIPFNKRVENSYDSHYFPITEAQNCYPFTLGFKTI